VPWCLLACPCSKIRNLPTPFPRVGRRKHFATAVEDSRQRRLVRLAYRWLTIGRLLLAIEPLCLLRKHGPIPSHLLIRNLYEGISCLLRKLSRAIRFAPILICSKSHRPLTRAPGVRSANRRRCKLGVGALAKLFAATTVRLLRLPFPRPDHVTRGRQVGFPTKLTGPGECRWCSMRCADAVPEPQRQDCRLRRPFAFELHDTQLQLGPASGRRPNFIGPRCARRVRGCICATVRDRSLHRRPS
jgi:hypothetical protein